MTPIEFNGWDLNKQGFKVELNEDLKEGGVLTTHDAVVLIYRNECSKWVIAPIALTKLPSKATITTIKSTPNDSIVESIVHTTCASSPSKPVFIEVEQAKSVFITTKRKESTNARSPSTDAIGQFLERIHMAQEVESEDD